MANPAQRGSTPDDDSWGKIATDLFGIQFNDDDDFELPDDQAPVAKTPPVSPSPVGATTSKAEEVHHADKIEEVVAEEPEPPKKGTTPGNEDHDEFWDILESWNWDETSKSSAPAKKADDSRGRKPARREPAPEPRRSQREEAPRR